MWHRVGTLFTGIASRISDFYKAHIFWRKIERALALHQRGEVRSDGLQLTSATTTLRIEWVARSVHPWDRNLPADKSDRLFSHQCLDDTHAALGRLFAEIPVLDTIEVRVRRNLLHPPILLGTVERESFRSQHCSSTAMKLRAMGLSFRMSNLCLEELETNSHQCPVD